MVYALITILYLSLWFLPWWGFVPLCFIFGCKAKSNLQSFMVGSTAVGLVWASLSYYQNIQAHGLMSIKMAEVLGLPYTWLVFLVTAALGAVLGGVWSLIGRLFYLNFWKIHGAQKPHKAEP